MTDAQIARVRATYNHAIAAHAESHRRWRHHARTVADVYADPDVTEQQIADALKVSRQSVSKWIRKARRPPTADVTQARPSTA